MLKRYANSVEILNELKAVDMLMACMVVPSIGRVKSACEGIYNKQQGRFYAIVDEAEIVSIIGYRIIDRSCEFTHFYFLEDKITIESLAEHIKEALCLDGLNQAENIVKEQDKALFKKLGFSIKPFKDNDLGYDRFRCVLKI